MPKNRRRAFNTECKLQMVQMIREQGLSVSQVCLGMEAWCLEAAADPTQLQGSAFSTTGYNLCGQLAMA